MENRPMPRLFVVRHGETEWSQQGCVTGRTDIPLTEHGVEQIRQCAPLLVGEGKVIDPKNLCTVFVSPRRRHDNLSFHHASSHKTFHLLFEGHELPHHVLTESCREWDYGDYEGLNPKEIQAIRPGWLIWRDGCPGGESIEQMQARVDSVIEQVREHHRQYFEGTVNTRDVMVVAHGHFNRCLIARWLKFDLFLGTRLNVQTGGVAVLSYNHNNLEEPALNASVIHLNSMLSFGPCLTTCVQIEPAR
ncbi:phosphoglycerate mutase-like protein [Fistulina hepatica ATCC 64428]|uniref:Phosphoglycerate mutase-like protein n=1 Tax=Fistulina hepatica ATCC 64428 TaxID=1128425 RepID=A0A0D7A5T2_9AGAR|nr:phosphoglycerate mutase-like protein [Fistulina hepatica ATCC 64428]